MGDRVRPRDEDVADDVHPRADQQGQLAAARVVDQVVAEIEGGMQHVGVAPLLRVAAAEERIAGVVSGEETVVDGDAVRAFAHQQAAAMAGAFGVVAVDQALGEDAVGDGHVRGIHVDVQVLVGRPTEGAVVEDNVLGLVVYGRAFVAGAEANVAEHDVVDTVVDDEVAARDRDAAARSRLARHGCVGQVGSAHPDRFLQADDAADAEENRAGAFGQECCAERSRPAVRQAGDEEHLAVAPPGVVAPQPSAPGKAGTSRARSSGSEPTIITTVTMAVRHSGKRMAKG